MADPGGPYTVAEGGAVDLLGSSSALDEPIVAYAWDLDDDGIFGEASTERGDETLQNPMYSAVGLDGPSSQPVALKVRDEFGAWSEVASTTVSLTNVAPRPRLTRHGGC